MGMGRSARESIGKVSIGKVSTALLSKTSLVFSGLRGIVWVIFDSTQAYHIEIMEIFRVSSQEKVVSFFG